MSDITSSCQTLQPLSFHLPLIHWVLATYIPSLFLCQDLCMHVFSSWNILSVDLHVFLLLNITSSKAKPDYPRYSSTFSPLIISCYHLHFPYPYPKYLIYWFNVYFLSSFNEKVSFIKEGKVSLACQYFWHLQ